jgi:lysozyme family protein
MTEKFLKCIPIILRNEGGYVNDPQDPGGETNFGICKKQFPDLDIAALTVDQAKDIYFDKYWNNLGFESVTPDLLALHMFDMAVNAGSKTAVKIVQNIVGSATDGILGPDTITKINAYPSADRLVNIYIAQRNSFYKGLAAQRPGLGKFLRGWTNRVKNTRFA